MTSAPLSIACFFVAATLIAPGCGRDEATPARDDSAAARPAGDAAPAGNMNTTTAVADIVGSPDRYFGQTVTVVADLEEVHSPLSFSLDEDAPLRGGIDRDLLVFSPKAGNLSEIDDQWLNNKVRVTGKVGKLTVVEIEREVGWDLNPEIEAEVERAAAVIIATSVQRVNNEQR